MATYECSECNYEGTSVVQMRAHSKVHSEQAIWWKKGEGPKGVEKPIGTVLLAQSPAKGAPVAGAVPGSLKKIVGYAIGLAILIGISYALGSSPSSALSSTPQLSSSWVSQFFGYVGGQRGQTYTECSQLDSLAQEKIPSIDYNKIILAPLYIELNASTNLPIKPIQYGVLEPSSYLKNLKNNDTDTYYKVTSTNFHYYGFFIYNDTGTFGNTTASTMHVFVELAPSCS